MDGNDMKKKTGFDIKGRMPGLDKLKKKKFNMKMLYYVAGGILLALVIFKVAGDIRNVIFKKGKKADELAAPVEGVPVKVYKVKRMDFKDTLPLLGTIKGYKEVTLKFQVSGILESFNFEEGENIQEGDIIANLEQKEALLKLKYADIELNNVKKMYEAGGLTESAVEKSKLEYESAKTDLEKTNIYAIADGVLGSQDMDVGSYLTPNDKVGMFVDVSRVYAEFEVIERDVPKLRLGQRCEIYIDALPGKNYIGTVDVISPIITGKTRTQRIKAELRNEGAAIKPGMFVRGLVSTYEKKNVIIIPFSSLKKQDDGYVVFVVHKDEKPEPEADEKKPAKGKKGKEPPEDEQMPVQEKETGTVEARVVQLGYKTQDKVEVEKGLEEGEIIVMELYQDMQDKEKVEIAEVQEILY